MYFFLILEQVPFLIFVILTSFSQLSTLKLCNPLLSFLFNAYIVPNLASGIPLKQVSMFFWYDPISLILFIWH